ncbi:hypothetical protein, partial [Zooshikella harenae]
MELEKIINHIFTYSFPTDEELVRFANERHGFGGDDGGYGVTYPSDLDAYEREIEQQSIPDGSVEVYCSAYTDEDIIVSEQQYLAVLKKYLETTGQHELACELKNV